LLGEAFQLPDVADEMCDVAFVDRGEIREREA
jgi:hypothetical protein